MDRIGGVALGNPYVPKRQPTAAVTTENHLNDSNSNITASRDEPLPSGVRRVAYLLCTTFRTAFNQGWLLCA